MTTLSEAIARLKAADRFPQYRLYYDAMKIIRQQQRMLKTTKEALEDINIGMMTFAGYEESESKLRIEAALEELSPDVELEE